MKSHKSIILFMLVALASLGLAAPVAAFEWSQASTSIRPGPVWMANDVATYIDIDTKTVVSNDTIVWDGTTVGWLNDSQALQTVYGDTFYPTAGAGYDTGIDGWDWLTIYPDTPILINFDRVPRDTTDGLPLPADAPYTIKADMPVIFFRTQSLCAGSGHPEVVRIVKFK